MNLIQRKVVGKSTTQKFPSFSQARRLNSIIRAVIPSIHIEFEKQALEIQAGLLYIGSSYDLFLNRIFAVLVSSLPQGVYWSSRKPIVENPDADSVDGTLKQIGLADDFSVQRVHQSHEIGFFIKQINSCLHELLWISHLDTLALK